MDNKKCVYDLGGHKLKSVEHLGIIVHCNGKTSEQINNVPTMAANKANQILGILNGKILILSPNCTQP